MKEDIMNHVITTSIPLIPAGSPAPGGGFFTRTMFDRENRPFHLITAPKAFGESAKSLTWKSALKFCAELEGEEWTAPDRMAALAQYENLGPRLSTTPELFREGGEEAFNTDIRYWLLTEHASYDGYAWCQAFNGGGQHYDAKSWSGLVRASRKIYL
jgi:hypothetical protein